MRKRHPLLRVNGRISVDHHLLINRVIKVIATASDRAFVSVQY